MNAKQKKQLIRIIIGAVVLVLMIVLEKNGFYGRLSQYAVLKTGIWNADVWERIIGLVFYLVPYGIAGWDVVYAAVRNICNGRVFDEDFLMCVASVAALGVGEYEEAAAVVLFFQVGQLFESYAVNRSRQSISSLMDIVPEYANVETDGKLEQVDPDDVEIDTVIVVLPGEKVPLDGVVVEGESMIDTSALTGESVPRKIQTGDEIISGCVNGAKPLHVKVTKEFDDCTVTKILEMVEEASSRKAPVENFITKFAKYYTPTVVILALILAILPPTVGKLLLPDIFTGGWSQWILRACTFLVISCPCALVISVPMGFFGGIGAASSRGILIKGSNYLEALSHIDTIVFDKTGTLTNGVFEVTDVRISDAWTAQGKNREDLLKLAAYAENFSTHPIAKSIEDAFDGDVDATAIGEYEELSGHGISAIVEGRKVYAGNAKLMKQALSEAEWNLFEQANEIYAANPKEAMNTCVYLAADGAYAGSIAISDVVKPTSKTAMEKLKRAGVRRTVMLTGDRRPVGEAVAADLGIDEVHAELLPQDKVSKVEELCSHLPQTKAKLAFVGDVINDAPVIARADIGMAMGSMGSDAAIEAADVVLMDDDLEKISTAVMIAGKTMRIVRENIVFALGVKFIVLILGALGMANMWAAVFADVGVSVIAILNSMRALRVNQK